MCPRTPNGTGQGRADRPKAKAGLLAAGAKDEKKPVRPLSMGWGGGAPAPPRWGLMASTALRAPPLPACGGGQTLGRERGGVFSKGYSDGPTGKPGQGTGSLGAKPAWSAPGPPAPSPRSRTLRTGQRTHWKEPQVGGHLRPNWPHPIPCSSSWGWACRGGGYCTGE